MNKGKVYLVGAGPGNPDFLTVRAKELLMKADIVAYDALIPSVLLSVLSEKSLNLPIGYRGYGSSKLKYGIHPKVIEMAKKGKIVVRLKSGDPFIFGRGSQECEALLKEGIQYEIIPGITSGLAAAISAGFPLTHKGFSSDVTFTSGHDLRGGSKTSSNWNAIAKLTGTVVIYMAASKVRENCQRLIELGKKKEMPAIFIACATHGDEEIVEGTLENLAEKTQKIHQKKQAVIIIGDVVQTRKYFPLALSGKSYLILRQRTQKSQLSERLKEQGASVIEAPIIKNIALENISFQLDKSAYLMSDADSVKYFIQSIYKNNYDLRDFSNVDFYVLDKNTKRELNSAGIKEKEILKGHCINALKVSSLPKKVILVTRVNSRKSLKEDLLLLEHEVEVLQIYKRQEHYLNINLPKFDGIICPSSSAVESFVHSPWFENLKNTKLFLMGEKTKRAAKKYKLNVSISNDDNLDSLINCIQDGASL